MPEGIEHPSDAIGGDTFEDPDKIVFIDELDEDDNVNRRIEAKKKYYDNPNIIRPEVEWLADGVVVLQLFLPLDEHRAESAAMAIGEKLDCTNALSSSSRSRTRRKAASSK